MSEASRPPARLLRIDALSLAYVTPASPQMANRPEPNKRSHEQHRTPNYVNDHFDRMGRVSRTATSASPAPSKADETMNSSSLATHRLQHLASYDAIRGDKRCSTLPRTTIWESAPARKGTQVSLSLLLVGGNCSSRSSILRAVPGQCGSKAQSPIFLVDSKLSNTMRRLQTHREEKGTKTPLRSMYITSSATLDQPHRHRRGRYTPRRLLIPIPQVSSISPSCLALAELISSLPDDSFQSAIGPRKTDLFRDIPPRTITSCEPDPLVQTTKYNMQPNGSPFPQC